MNNKLPFYFLALGVLLICVHDLYAQKIDNKVKKLSLNECIETALENHPKLQIYSNKTLQKKSKLKAYKVENLPRADFLGSYDRLSFVAQSKERFLKGSGNDFQADIVLSMPLYTGGRIASMKRSGKFALEAAQKEYLSAREEIIFFVKASYYKMIFARDMHKSKQELLKYSELAYKTAYDLYKRKKVPREETVLRLEVALNEVMQELIDAKQNLETAKKSLLNSMGLDTGDSIVIEELEDDFGMTAAGSRNLSGNYDILSLASKIKEADSLVRASVSAFYPQLAARFSYGYEWPGLSKGDDIWTAGVTLDFNIWDWGKNRAEVSYARAYLAELKSYKDMISKDIELEYETARLKFESAYKRFGIAKQSLLKAKRSLDLFERRYRDSLVTSLELLDAQKAFSQAQVSYAQSLLDTRTALAQMKRITG